MTRNLVRAGLLIACVATTARADQRWTHYGARPLAMGNAFVAVSDDYNALFYNPAGMARLDEWDMGWINPRLEFSQNTAAFLNELTSLLGGNASNLDETLDVFEGQVGKSQHAALSLTPHLVFPGFGFGLGFDLVNSMAFTKSPAVEVNTGTNIILPITYAFNLLEDRLSLGVSLKLRARGGIDKELSIESIGAFAGGEESSTGETVQLDQFFEGGFGVGGDVGLLFTPIKTMEPTLGLAISDFGGTPYTKFDVGGTALGAPDARLPSVNLGISLKPSHDDRSYTMLAIDMHGINQPTSFSKKLSLGTEYGYTDIIKLGAGLYHGYLTAGLQFDVGLLNLRALTYAEELGTVAGETADRRYVIQMKLLL